MFCLFNLPQGIYGRVVNFLGTLSSLSVVDIIIQIGRLSLGFKNYGSTTGFIVGLFCHGRHVPIPVKRWELFNIGSFQ